MTELPVRFAGPISRVPGKISANTFLLVNGRTLTPAGSQSEIEPLPLSAVRSPDGRHLLVSESPRAWQYLQLLSARNLRSEEQVFYPRPKSVFVGLTYSDHGRWVFAAGGGQNVVHTFAVARDGHLNPRANINLDPMELFDPFPVGLATADNDRTLIVAENHANAVVIIRLRDRRIVSSFPVGSFPYAVVTRRNDVYVSDWGSNAVSVLKVPDQCGSMGPCSPRLVRTIGVGAHPCAMALYGQFLYVANANSDKVSIVSTKTNSTVSTIFLKPSLHAPLGASPEALAVDRSGERLYVVLSGDNAVAVVSLTSGGSRGALLGEIPTAAYPTSVTLSGDGSRLFVTSALGYGSRPNNPASRPYNQVPGILSAFPIPDSRALRRATEIVARNNRTSRMLTPAGNNAQSPWPNRSPIQHVIYIIRENQTYDNVFGDLKDANGDRALTSYGAYFTPNGHALAEHFGILDNFYDDGATSSDGHNWVMSANDNDFNQKMWPEAYSGRQEYGLNPGASPMGFSPGGYLWDRAGQSGVSYRDYGEFFLPPVRDKNFIPSSRASSCAGAIATRYAMLTIPKGDVLCLPSSRIQPMNYSLIGHYDPHYRGLDMNYSDLDREREWEREFHAYVLHNDLPQLEVMFLPNDHTAGGNGYLTKESYVAQNDRALGLIIQAVSHSPYWSSTAIFVTQDDAQGSRDHVNSQRTESLVISPYTQHPKPRVESGLWDNNSMLRTIELLLGLKPMSEFDATADPMWGAFQTNPDVRPFTALPLAVPWTVQH